MILPFIATDPGILAWRRVDPRGQSCVSCHSPDGIELSAYGFSREDVVRRASRHVGAGDTASIVAMLERRAAMAKPMDDRPLQPGGQPLPGPTAGERDLVFLRQLSSVAPLFAEGRIASEADALRVRDEMLRVDLSALRVGIPFNRLSEDAFHGSEHRTVANWIPDVPVRGISQEASDRYLADPSDENLRALDRGVRDALPSARTPGETLAAMKYRALLVLQHRLRTGRFILPVELHARGLNQNPLWDVADFGRRYAEDTDIASLGLPADVAAAKRDGPAYADQLRDLRLPWFWMGWTLDPGLQNSGMDGETRRGDYFVRSLWRDGPYPGHLAFMLTKKLVEQGFNPRRWNEPRYAQRYEMDLSGFVKGDELGGFHPTGEYRRRFERVATNALRTALYLSRQSVRDTDGAFDPEAQANQARLALDYLRRVDPRPADGPLVKDLLARLSKAKPLR